MVEVDPAVTSKPEVMMVVSVVILGVTVDAVVRIVVPMTLLSMVLVENELMVVSVSLPVILDCWLIDVMAIGVEISCMVEL